MKQKLDLAGPLRAAALHYAKVKAGVVADAIAQRRPDLVAAAAGSGSQLHCNVLAGTVTHSDVEHWAKAQAKQAHRRAKRVAIRGRAAALASLTVPKAAA